MPELVASAFRALAGVRGARAFHPRGRWFTGAVTTTFDAALPLPTGRTEVVGRLSKGAGTPDGVPDVLGLAFRLPGPWDVLLSTSFARVLPRPVRTWSSARYGSIAPFRWRGRLVWLAAVPDPGQTGSAALEDLPDELRFTLEVSGPWRPVGRLVARPLPVDDERPPLDPVVHRPPGLELAPALLTRFRERAYRGSRRGRPAGQDPEVT
ncbi:hypothetical protein [Saccharothrix syringae]|uniref:Phosphodiesterase n=1 Tax=Saccharothrix syringae TaxID=103733 RepID=A0A5Q0H0G2_SACSY|nr:hypothetical protein [Saccharothrix syringae]QFZ19152.1 hypothetical protein EKG83_18405 [Saccharothrix syringae]